MPPCLPTLTMHDEDATTIAVCVDYPDFNFPPRPGSDKVTPVLIILKIYDIQICGNYLDFYSVEIKF